MPEKEAHAELAVKQRSVFHCQRNVAFKFTVWNYHVWENVKRSITDTFQYRRMVNIIAELKQMLQVTA